MRGEVGPSSMKVPSDSKTGSQSKPDPSSRRKASGEKQPLTLSMIDQCRELSFVHFESGRGRIYSLDPEIRTRLKGAHHVPKVVKLKILTPNYCFETSSKTYR